MYGTFSKIKNNCGLFFVMGCISYRPWDEGLTCQPAQEFCYNAVFGHDVYYANNHITCPGNLISTGI